MKSLYFSYNGIIYLIFCDALFRFKENKYVKMADNSFKFTSYNI